MSYLGQICNELVDLYYNYTYQTEHDNQAKAAFLNDSYNKINLINKIVALAANGIRAEEQMTVQTQSNVQQNSVQSATETVKEYVGIDKKTLDNSLDSLRNSMRLEMRQQMIGIENKIEEEKISLKDIEKIVSKVIGGVFTLTSAANPFDLTLAKPVPESTTPENTYSMDRDTLDNLLEETEKNTVVEDETNNDSMEEETENVEETEQKMNNEEERDRLIDKLNELGQMTEEEEARSNETMRELEQYFDKEPIDLVKFELELWGANPKWAGYNNLMKLPDIVTECDMGDINGVISALAEANEISENQLLRNLKFLADRADFTNTKLIPVLCNMVKSGHKVGEETMLKELSEFFM